MGLRFPFALLADFERYRYATVSKDKKSREWEGIGNKFLSDDWQKSGRVQHTTWRHHS